MKVDRHALIALVIVGCGTSVPASSEKQQKPEPEMGGDQYALLADIRAAEEAEPDTRPERFDDVMRAWRGRRVRWEVAVLAPLCARSEACVALPFDHARLEDGSGQGWLPRLDLDAAEHARIRRACEGRTTCVIGIDASVSHVRLSTELPTAVTLGGVRLVSVRAVASDEAWARQPS